MKFIYFLLLPLASLWANEENQLTSKDLLLLYNSNSLESKELAEYYAAKRNVPADALIGIKMPLAEEITRTQFVEIRKTFNQKVESLDRWQRVIVTFKGVPFGVKRDGKSNNEASFDSELAMAAVINISGGRKNPYFNKNHGLKNHWKLYDKTRRVTPVCRIDGPSLKICKNLIDDTLATEKTGLWGVTQLDKAFKGKGFEAGDISLDAIEKVNWANGIPTSVESSKQMLPSGYPTQDIACYFGWYTEHVNGPFRDEQFRFKRGAVAAHLHSFSARSLRSPNTNWVGPLLSKGACAVLGNVYEPYFSGTTQFDIFYRRLLAGHTLAEAAYMGTPVLSWQTVVIGDPLYRPFKHLEQTSGELNNADRPFRIMNILWKLESVDEEKRIAKLRSAAVKTSDYRIFEYLGLWLKYKSQFRKADIFFKATQNLKPTEKGLIRNVLHRAELYRELNQKLYAVKILKAAEKAFKDSPHLNSITTMLINLSPPSPK